jgi:hypothetical protein
MAGQSIHAIQRTNRYELVDESAAYVQTMREGIACFGHWRLVPNMPQEGLFRLYAQGMASLETHAMGTIKISIELDTHGQRGPMFIATLPDGTRTKPSLTPFCHAAREVLRLNLAKPEDTIEMHREGIMCLTASVETAAALTVRENEVESPHFVRYHLRSAAGVAD